MTFQYIYPDYKDLATGKTLVVTPGSAYTIAIAPGRNSAAPAFPNDGRWSSATNFVAMEAVEPRAASTTGAASGTLKTVGTVADSDSDKPKEGANDARS
jgi:hypothetical protein